MAKIVAYSTCNCGAITVYYDDGFTNSVKKKNLKKFGIKLRGLKKNDNTWCCNHCANHYGIDICDCGSGEEVGKCSCGSNSAMEQFGYEYDGFSQIVKNFSR